MCPLPRSTVLLDQQLWFLGHDIRHADGNALLRYGFERRRAPYASGGCYVLRLDEHTAFVCAGFGVYLGAVEETGEACLLERTLRHGDGVLWRRHTRAPRLVARPLTLPLAGPSDLPRCRDAVSCDARLLLREGAARLAGLFASYEAWALATLGPAHRHHALARLPRHKRRRLRQPSPALMADWREYHM